MNANTSATNQELTLRQAADRLGFSLYRVELLAQSGHLQARLCNNEWLVTKTSLAAFEGGRSGSSK